MTVLRRVLVALLLTGLLAAWVLPASAEDTAPAVGGTEAEAGAGDPSEPAIADPDTEDPGTDPVGPGTEEPNDPADPVDPTEPVDPGTEEPAGPRVLEGAVLRWGLNNESNNRAFAPGTFNFFSAGRLGDPGRGGQTLLGSTGGRQWSGGGSAGWSAASGNVSIEKWDAPAQSYQGASWAGLTTDENGASIPTPTSGRFSGHQLVFSGGTGTYDETTGELSLAWVGDATIVYYSGMTFFYLGDPELRITGTTGTLTAELSGYSSSMEDTSQWGPVAPRRATIATFSTAGPVQGDVFTAVPDYDDVVTTPNQAGPGSFPADFIRFQEEAGAASYWYASGGSADRFKKALPVTALLGEDAVPPAPVIPAAPTTALPSNTALAAPPARAPRGATPPIAPVAVQQTPRTPAADQSAGDHGWMLGQVPVSDQLVWWLLAAALLTMTTSTVTASAVYVRRLRPTA